MMKAGTLLENAEGVALLAGLAIAGYLVWKGIASSKAIANTVESVANKASQIYTTAKTEGADAVARTEVAMQKLIAPDAATVTIQTPPGASTAQIRRDAVNLLDGLRIAEAVRKTLPQNVLSSSWSDFKDWYDADTTGKAVRDNFWNRNPDGVFYD